LTAQNILNKLAFLPVGSHSAAAIIAKTLVIGNIFLYFILNVKKRIRNINREVISCFTSSFWPSMSIPSTLFALCTAALDSTSLDPSCTFGGRRRAVVGLNDRFTSEEFASPALFSLFPLSSEGSS
jgi:hypothetical protein